MNTKKIMFLVFFFLMFFYGHGVYADTTIEITFSNNNHLVWKFNPYEQTASSAVMNEIIAASSKNDIIEYRENSGDNNISFFPSFLGILVGQKSLNRVVLEGSITLAKETIKAIMLNLSYLIIAMGDKNPIILFDKDYIDLWLKPINSIEISEANQPTLATHNYSLSDILNIIPALPNTGTPMNSSLLTSEPTAIGQNSDAIFLTIPTNLPITPEYINPTKIQNLLQSWACDSPFVFLFNLQNTLSNISPELSSLTSTTASTSSASSTSSSSQTTNTFVIEQTQSGFSTVSNPQNNELEVISNSPSSPSTSSLSSSTLSIENLLAGLENEKFKLSKDITNSSELSLSNILLKSKERIVEYKRELYRQINAINNSNLPMLRNYFKEKIRVIKRLTTTWLNKIKPNVTFEIKGFTTTKNVDDTDDYRSADYDQATQLIDTLTKLRPSSQTNSLDNTAVIIQETLVVLNELVILLEINKQLGILSTRGSTAATGQASGSSLTLSSFTTTTASAASTCTHNYIKIICENDKLYEWRIDPNNTDSKAKIKEIVYQNKIKAFTELTYNNRESVFGEVDIYILAQPSLNFLYLKGDAFFTQGLKTYINNYLTNLIVDWERSNVSYTDKYVGLILKQSNNIDIIEHLSSSSSSAVSSTSSSDTKDKPTKRLKLPYSTNSDTTSSSSSASRPTTTEQGLGVLSTPAPSTSTSTAAAIFAANPISKQRKRRTPDLRTQGCQKRYKSSTFSSPDATSSSLSQTSGSTTDTGTGTNDRLMLALSALEKYSQPMSGLNQNNTTSDTETETNFNVLEPNPQAQLNTNPTNLSFNSTFTPLTENTRSPTGTFYGISMSTEDDPTSNKTSTSTGALATTQSVTSDTTQNGVYDLGHFPHYDTDILNDNYFNRNNTSSLTGTLTTTQSATSTSSSSSGQSSPASTSMDTSTLGLNQGNTNKRVLDYHREQREPVTNSKKHNQATRQNISVEIFRYYQNWLLGLESQALHGSISREELKLRLEEIIRELDNLKLNQVLLGMLKAISRAINARLNLNADVPLDKKQPVDFEEESAKNSPDPAIDEYRMPFDGFFENTKKIKNKEKHSLGKGKTYQAPAFNLYSGIMIGS